MKPGGKIIHLTPNWIYIYKMFYEDYTHRTPWTEKSLRDIHLIHGFKSVKVENFKQLPEIFENKNLKRNMYKFASFITEKLIPDHFKLYSKWIRFSKEIMLLSYAEK